MASIGFVPLWVVCTSSRDQGIRAYSNLVEITVTATITNTITITGTIIIIIICLLPPHTVTVYNRATIKVLIYPYYEYWPTVTERGQYPNHHHHRHHNQHQHQQLQQQMLQHRFSRQPEICRSNHRFKEVCLQSSKAFSPTSANGFGASGLEGQSFRGMETCRLVLSSRLQPTPQMCSSSLACRLCAKYWRLKHE